MMLRNGRRTRKGALLFGLAGLLCGGCSVFFVQGPTKVGPDDYVPARCSTSQTAPVLDVLVTGLQAMRTLVAVTQTDQDYRGMVITRDLDIGVGAAMTAAFAASAIYGFVTVNHCRELRGGVVVPTPRAPPRRTRAEQAADRRAEEAAEEAAVQARVKARRAAEDQAARDAPDAAANPDAGGDAGP